MLSRTTNLLAGRHTIHHHHGGGRYNNRRIMRLLSSSNSSNSRRNHRAVAATVSSNTTNDFPYSNKYTALVGTSTTLATMGAALLSSQRRAASNNNNNMNNQRAAYAALLAASTTLAALTMAQTTPTTHLDQAPPPPSPPHEKEDDEDEADDEPPTILNWSGTHTTTPLHYHEPETISQLLSTVSHAHTHSLPLRPVGSALSPNGIAFQPNGMVSLAHLDQILHIDKDTMTVRVQAGARVSQVIEELRPHGLTLPNLASIAEQQMGGFTQIGAHGTGAAIAPIDEYVTGLTLVTPTEGRVVLSNNDDDAEDGGEMFRLARVGLGCLGIVADVTMKVVPAHRLLEHTYTVSRAEAREGLGRLLKKHKHVRYMWIPYEDTVIVVTNDVEDDASVGIVETSRAAAAAAGGGGNGGNGGATSKERFAPLQNLLIDMTKDAEEPYTMENLEGRGFGALRDALIALNPLDVEHMKVVNKAEAEFWRKSEGYQLRNSDELLQFDCGGQQWVYEVCLPTGTYETNNGNDMKFMENLLSEIEKEQIPAHPPIEQRWSASSSSPMSPAYGKAGEGGLFCWVGIIMYLPDEGEKIRQAITDKFQNQYCDLAKRVGTPLQTVSHWGKLEMPTSPADYERLRSSMLRRYPVEEFNAARLRFDPKNILGNRLVDVVLGTPDPKLIFPRR